MACGIVANQIFTYAVDIKFVDCTQLHHSSDVRWEVDAQFSEFASSSTVLKFHKLVASTVRVSILTNIRYSNIEAHHSLLFGKLSDEKIGLIRLARLKYMTSTI
jgi:hypothetical protein